MPVLAMMPVLTVRSVVIVVMRMAMLVVQPALLFVSIFTMIPVAVPIMVLASGCFWRRGLCLDFT